MSKTDKNRIYGIKTNISESDAKLFWNKRANKYDANNPYVTIKLGDRHPERARQWDEYEKKHVLPQLKITHDDIVLDIGCGVGRLSEKIIPECKFYLGTDFAGELLELANKRIYHPRKNYVFAQIALQDISENNKQIPLDKGKYTISIIEGVFPFINDSQIQSCLCSILTVMAETCRIFIANPVGIKERLTLKNFFSDELEAEYSVIYRTEEEYMEQFAILSENGFRLSDRGNFMVETANNNETKRIYHIFTRN